MTSGGTGLPGPRQARVHAYTGADIAAAARREITRQKGGFSRLALEEPWLVCCDAVRCAGVNLPTPSWGSMVSDGGAYLNSALWLASAPALTIMITVIAVNLLGDGLRDALDPALRGSIS
jgi:hypothetical protein